MKSRYFVYKADTDYCWKNTLNFRQRKLRFWRPMTLSWLT